MLYLAMTAAEISANPVLPSPLGYMACHFSAYGAGLSNLPEALPEGSMLILNDRTPIAGHSPALVAAQLTQTARELRCSRLLLDFQRPGEPEALPILEAILAQAPCPAAVSALYAKALACPVFLPPVPLCTPLSEYLAPWTGRELWLEAALDAQTVTVDADGSRSAFCPPPDGPLPHRDEALCCHYQLALDRDKAIFTLARTREDLHLLMERAENVACFVGLYQELGAL